MGKFELDDERVEGLPTVEIETTDGILTIEYDYWAGMPNYHCPHCKHATLEKGKLPAHMAKHHGETYAGPEYEEPLTHD